MCVSIRRCHVTYGESLSEREQRTDETTSARGPAGCDASLGSLGRNCHSRKIPPRASSFHRHAAVVRSTRRRRRRKRRGPPYYTHTCTYTRAVVDLPLLKLASPRQIIHKFVCMGGQVAAFDASSLPPSPTYTFPPHPFLLHAAH